MTTHTQDLTQLYTHKKWQHKPKYSQAMLEAMRGIKHSDWTVTNRAELDAFASVAITGKLPSMPDTWCYLRYDGRHSCDVKNTWAYVYRKFEKFMNTGTPQFLIFNPKGNKKLKFYAFSTLPGSLGCPGMGACQDWCYSLKAWRYPEPYFRQLQNLLLVKAQSEYITEAFQAIPHGKTLRLYVDGDHDSLETLQMWFDLLKTRPDLQVYGYSKSWDLFLKYNASGQTFPSNYVLNLSSGSKFESFPLSQLGMKEKMLMLECVRNLFLALQVDVPMPKDGRADQPAFLAHVRAVKKAAKDEGYGNVFVCPGKCYDCMPNGEHACGNKSINVPVAIGIH